MKNKNPNNKLFEIILPFGASEDEGPFFDDCEICQEMKRELEKGNLERVELPEMPGSGWVN